jgi:hypothetical protein
MYREDGHYKVTYKSWYQRLIESFFGVIIGFILLLIATGVLWWNEGRAIKRTKALEEGQSSVVSVSTEKALEENNAKLIHFNGMPLSEEILSDPDFGVDINALRLKRVVEMFQWQEYSDTYTETYDDGSSETITSYTYDAVWSSTLINSNIFDDRSYQNPREFRLIAKSYNASDVKVGNFNLSQNMINELDHWLDIKIPNTEYPSHEGLRIFQDGATNIAYLGFGAPQKPEIGDHRIYFKAVEPEAISVVAQQNGSQLSTYETDNGPLELIEYGTLNANQMFEKAKQDNTAMTWGLRLLGLTLMLFGFLLIFKPLVVMGRPVPIIGPMVSLGTGMLAFVLALSSSLSVIAVSWLFYRPILGLGLMIGVIALMSSGWVFAKKKKSIN